MKTCTKCLEVKDESEYSLKPNGAPKAHCKKCHSAYNNAKLKVSDKRCYEPTSEPKRCYICKVSQDPHNFYTDPRRKDGLHPCCKSCKAEIHYRKTYGLEPEQYKAMLSQGCEVCGDILGRIVIDHCHDTGRVRGALCSNCNTALGLLGENPLRINNLANYILRTR